MDRERITISIKSALLKEIDKKIDGARMRNRSHAIELLVSQSLGLSQFETAVIMAGGKGAIRLIPVIESAIENLKSFGFSEIYIATGFLGDKIKQAIGDGKKYQIRINYIEGGEGTAGALLPLKDKVKKTFAVINSDEIINLNLKNLFDFHQNHLSQATIATKNVELMRGYYIFEPEIFSYIPKGFSMLEEDVFPQLSEEGKLLLYPLR
ncbi:MAG: sugar phosphate nucleotidyltransferase [Candidatus Berkelbacteria bacterium]|nr:sugar phosphate nucleotidyltransferase [Candidatus Berkelbacteria bacterium]